VAGTFVAGHVPRNTMLRLIPFSVNTLFPFVIGYNFTKFVRHIATW